MTNAKISVFVESISEPGQKPLCVSDFFLNLIKSRKIRKRISMFFVVDFYFVQSGLTVRVKNVLSALD
jgi:hypothetical protein